MTIYFKSQTRRARRERVLETPPTNSRSFSSANSQISSSGNPIVPEKLFNLINFYTRKRKERERESDTHTHTNHHFRNIFCLHTRTTKSRSFRSCIFFGFRANMDINASSGKNYNPRLGTAEFALPPLLRSARPLPPLKKKESPLCSFSVFRVGALGAQAGKGGKDFAWSAAAFQFYIVATSCTTTRLAFTSRTSSTARACRRCRCGNNTRCTFRPARAKEKRSERETPS